jgi:hypothetical protein
VQFQVLSLPKKARPLSKIIRAKKAGGMAETIEHLPSKNKAPSSNLSSTKIKKDIYQDHIIA